MAKPVLEVKAVSKSFGTVQALKNVQLDLYPGEVVALMGENGAGKSTLMNILCGAFSHYEGQVFIDGKEIHMSSPQVSHHVGVAKIHQELQLVREMTIAENIFMGRELVNRIGGVDTKRMEREAAKYLAMLELDVSPSTKIKDLRVGEQQLVEIAKAISLDTRVLIMDEPTSAISKSETEVLYRVIRRLVSEGVGIVYITHRMEEVFTLADRITVFRDGEYINTVRAGDTTREDIIYMMVGRKVNEQFPKQSVPLGDEVLRVENLNYMPPEGSFRRALHNINLSLHKGEVLGIAGLMGAGRSEFFECLFGVHPAHTTGNIFVDGKKCIIRSPKDAIDVGLSFATEDRKGSGLVLQRSIGENMSLPLLLEFSKYFFMDTKSEKVFWQEEMNNLRIKAPGYQTLVGNLSGGNQQKVVLGRWLMSKPKVLLLDEPTRGIDVGAKAEIYVLINELAKSGLGVIVISSELPEVIGVSDRILTFCEGHLTGAFSHEEATQEKLLYAATLREEAGV